MKYYVICNKCKKMLEVTARDIGIICRCHNYIRVTERISLDKVIDTLDTGNFHIPNKDLINYRDKMEEHAYDWAAKQSHKPRMYHGPINPETGEHDK